MASETKKIVGVTINTKNLDQTVLFYKDLLGFENNDYLVENVKKTNTCSIQLPASTTVNFVDVNGNSNDDIGDVRLLIN
jgi:catechol 2,3-dioxygenase-like lactoylglutathione lyase family enzyme